MSNDVVGWLIIFKRHKNKELIKRPETFRGVFFCAIHMKDYGKILTHTNKAIYQQILHPGSNRKRLGEWDALKAIEASAMVIKDRVDALIGPDGYREEINKVEVELLENEVVGEKVLIKAQLFVVNKKEHRLKVFAHQLKANGKSSKLAKAVYHVRIVRNEVAA